MTKPAHLRDDILKILPPYSARNWMFARSISRRRPDLKGVHAALAYMVRTQHAARKVDEITGLYVYARAKRNGRS